MTTTAVDIVTPQEAVYSGQATQVDIPGAEGDFGVLANHAPMISTIRPGVIKIFTDEAKSKQERLFVSSGFVEVIDNRCTILATSITDLSKASKDELKKQLEEAERELKIVIDQDEQMTLQKKVNALSAIIASL